MIFVYFIHLHILIPTGNIAKKFLDGALHTATPAIAPETSSENELQRNPAEHLRISASFPATLANSVLR